jgi:hypothetical protein
MKKPDCIFCGGTKTHSNRGATADMCPGFLEVRRARLRRAWHAQDWQQREKLQLRKMKAQRAKRHAR